MRSRPLIARAAAVILVATLAVASIVVVRQHIFGPQTFTALFSSATGIYPGDEVRVAGVKVGTIQSIQPRANDTKITMHVDHDVPVPADAKAVVVAQNLVAARYIQLTPAYIDSGPTMPDGTLIPRERTAVPVEWDEVKDQLSRLATELGPDNGASTGTAGRFIDSAANALKGNGDKLRQSLAEMSQLARLLAERSGNIVDIIKNLQTFVTALRDSNEQIVQFEDRLATLSSVLDGSKSTLDAALTNLSAAVADVQRFVANTRDKSVEQVQRLANVTQTLADQKKDVEQLLHVFPNQMANFYNAYDPVTGAITGAFGLNMFENPLQFICAGLAAVQPANPADSAKKCAEYLGPALRLANPLTYLNINYLPIPLNPFLGPAPRPDQLIYSEPQLIPPGIQGAPSAPPAPTLPEMMLPAERPSS